MLVPTGQVKKAFCRGKEPSAHKNADTRMGRKGTVPPAGHRGREALNRAGRVQRLLVGIQPWEETLCRKGVGWWGVATAPPRVSEPLGFHVEKKRNPA